ncbi:protein kinase family protein [Allonocardiopsis opalescens]|uniref:Protein kinase domain-containing protein n=1 Tax=Allonocardiopsis opalescens TaxID=1144618 RepID=A0A2T0Q6X2_9ACTN|nr:protein kinase family protein [Allonocardiopsis opalescens]PRX99562.1 hypothetical protein CLV72_103163 [Allonocardiopsis opalescens]
MSAFTFEPGTRLDGRYLLKGRVTDSGGAALWEAIDETLARPVAVRTFHPQFPRIRDVVMAARATSRLTDSRVTRIFDANDGAAGGDVAYVVEEWVSGQHLGELVADGPLEAEHAAALVSEAAEALAAAHAAGLYHLHLSPSQLFWTNSGTLKVMGVGVEAALVGGQVADPGRTDAQGLGRLLYAALTGRWPGPDPTMLPPAPVFGGQVAAPRQVSPDVPMELDAITCRAAFQTPQRGRAPLAAPSEVAAALLDVPRAIPVPEVHVAAPALAAAPPADTMIGRYDRYEDLLPPVRRDPPSGPPRSGRGRRAAAPEPMVNRALVAVIVIVVVAAVGVGGWLIGRAASAPGGPLGPEPSTSPTDTAPEIEQLAVSAASTLDMVGSEGTDNESAPNAIDGDPATSWQTQWYTTADFGRLKDGVGLVLDMGAPVSVAEIDVVLADVTGAEFDVMIGDQPDIAALETVGSSAGPGGEVPFELDEPVEGRYVVLWFTQLPPDNDENFRVHVNEVELRGNS